MTEWMRCPVCLDAVPTPTDPTEQVEWLRANAAALGAMADRIESGEDYRTARRAERVQDG